MRGNKKIKVNCGPQVEEIELVRVRRERSPAKPRDPPLTLKTITEFKDTFSEIKKVQVLQTDSNVSSVKYEDKEHPAPVKQAPLTLSNSEKVQVHLDAQSSPTKLNEQQPIINIRKGPSYGERAKMFYEKSQAKNQNDHDHFHINDPDRPKPDIKDILDALTELDRKVAVSLLSNPDISKKKTSYIPSYFPTPYSGLYIIRR